LILAQEEKISATLGDTALRGALIAALVGIIIIAVMMLIMYGPKKMFISILSLTIFLTILLAVAKMIDYAFSLSGIAALILTIGMGVDVNILIFERLREEFKSGKSAFQAIDIAYERSLAPIRDGNLSTGLIAFLFFTMGVSIFKGFGAMMLITMILMLFINVPLTKDLLHLFYDRKRSV
jgi:protein-export membrane protein SecD